MLRALGSTGVVVVLVVAAAYGMAGVTAADDVTLEITAVDENDRPVGGVDLVVTWDDGESRTEVTTTSDGRALVDVPEGATVLIATDDDEYVRNRPYRVFDVGSGDQVDVSVSEIGRVTFAIEGAEGAVSGADIVVREPGRQIAALTTNESGIARSGPLELGEYTVRITPPGHLQNQTTIEITRVEKTETISVQRADVDVTVSVVDDNFASPRQVENARVRFTDLGRTFTTGDDGTATGSVPVNQRHRVRIIKDGYDAKRASIRVGEDPESLEVSITREPALAVESVNRQVIVGESTVVTVTDEYEERVEGATVSVDGERVGQTDPQGQVRVPVETAGEVTVEVSSGDATATTTVEGVDTSATETPAATPTPSPTPAPTPTPTPGGSGPGFGVLVALLAVLAVGLLARRR